jgi:hypothetical protein
MPEKTWLSLVFLASSTSAQAANFEIRPVSADVLFVVAGDEIFLPNGLAQSAVVTFDIFVSGWAAESFRGAQFWKLVSGGTSGSITPYNPTCSTDGDCDQLVGPFGDCVSNGCGFGFFQQRTLRFCFQRRAHRYRLQP